MSIHQIFLLNNSYLFQLSLPLFFLLPADSTFNPQGPYSPKWKRKLKVRVCIFSLLLICCLCNSQPFPSMSHACSVCADHQWIPAPKEKRRQEKVHSGSLRQSGCYGSPCGLPLREDRACEEQWYGLLSPNNSLNASAQPFSSSFPPSSVTVRFPSQVGREVWIWRQRSTVGSGSVQSDGLRE